MKKIPWVLIIIAAGFALAGEHDALVSQINQKYFSLEREGVKAFECKLSNSLIEELVPQIKESLDKESQTFKDLAKIESKGFFDQGALEVEISEIADIENNPGLVQMMELTRQMYSGFFDFWLGLMYEPLITEQDAKGLTIAETGDGYQVHVAANDEDGQVTYHFNREWVIQGMDIKFGSNHSFLKPTFRATPKGLVVESCAININNAMVVTSVKVEYQDVEGYAMPAKAFFKSEMTNMTREFEVRISDYRLKR